MQFLPKDDVYTNVVVEKVNEDKSTKRYIMSPRHSVIISKLVLLEQLR